MGYIDKELNIKTAKALAEYIFGRTKKDVRVIKVTKSLKVIWAIDSIIHTFKIQASVIYAVEVVDVEEAIRTINNSLKK